MTMKQFAKLIRMDEDAFYALDWPECRALVEKHGYYFTNAGIFPKPGETQRTEFQN